MNPSPLWHGIAALLPLLLATLGTGCSSQPSQLYLLNSLSPSPQSPMAAQAGVTPMGSGSSRPAGVSKSANRPLVIVAVAVAVAVSVPEYLDRLDIVERTSANELKPIHSAQWGESLAVAATRAVAENLVALLPSDDVIMLPSRSREGFEYQVNLDLTRFESDSEGRSTVAGRWSISDREGRKRAGGRVLRSERAEREGYDAMAAAMSRNLAAVCGDIADALQRLSAVPRSTSAAGRANR
jgi:uncharacterized lipoprotein YmbA